VFEHPDFAALIGSWDLAMRSDGYAKLTRASYTRGVRSLAGWLAEHHGPVPPGDVTRAHIRGWLVDVRESASSGTARSWFPGVRHFYRWAVSEQEADHDPTEGVRTPRPNDTSTPVLSMEQLRTLLKTCAGKTFIDRRDTAVIMLFADGGLRLAELAGLTVDAVDVASGAVYVEGKGSMRSGPRRRLVALGVNATRALDGYLRARRRHPHADKPQLWLGDRNRPSLSHDGVKRMVQRRGEQAGVRLHPHMFRHTWASAFREADGSEGDLMVLGGWRSRAMLDRYGSAVAAERARRAYRTRSLGDKL
jgi:site-specific recombinase XerD